MRDPPDRIKRGGVGGEARNDMPMNMRQLIAEQLIVHFTRLENSCQGFSDMGYFFHQLKPLGWCQLEQFGRMAPEHDHRPSRKELIVMQVGLGQTQFDDQEIFSWPDALASLAGGIAHG